MKVLYDHQAFTGKKYGGISRYFYELMSYYRQHKNLLEFELALLFSNNAYLEEVKLSDHHTFRHLIGYTRTNRLVSLINRLYSIRALKTSTFDLFHPTFYHPYFLNYLNEKPFVLTFHDCTSEKFHHLYPSLGGDQYDLKQLLLNKATRVIAISQSTKKDLLEYFEIDESKIDVIYHCTNFSELTTAPYPPVEVPERYLLFVGDRLDYKNFNLFIEAVAPLLKRDKNLYVVCAGGRPFTQEEVNMLNGLEIYDKVKYHDIFDSHTLRALYHQAICFVFPSLNEGFGLPILEAFACDCPVLLSDNSCFPEIAEDAALYFDPFSAESIRSSVETIIGSTDLRSALITKGTARLQSFSKEKMALETWECYTKALAEHSLITN